MLFYPCFALIAFLFEFCIRFQFSLAATVVTAPKPRPPNIRPVAPPVTAHYDKFTEEIKLWQDANPSVCGEDTTNCRVERLIEEFQSCETPDPNPFFRIVNGCLVNQHSTLGWQVAIQINGSLCSGTMMSPRHAVLAAHCFDGLVGLAKRQAVLDTSSPASANFFVSISVAAQRVSYRPIEQRFQVLAFATHPKYTSKYYDVAIVKLNRDVPFNTNGIRPACLPTNVTSRTAGNCVVSGYGVDNIVYMTGEGTLRYTVLSVVKDETCTEVYGAVNNGNGGTFNKAVSFCAIGVHGDDYTDTCLGDSGSGLLCKDEHSGRWTLQGVVSYGPRACTTWPGVYAEAYTLGLQSKRQKLLPQPNQCQRISANGIVTDGNAIGTPAASKKAAGIARTATETIKRHGCSNNDQCQTSICRQVVLCIAIAKPTQPVITGAVAARPAKEDETILKQLSFVVQNQNYIDQRCARANICWASSWLKFYKNVVPTFDLHNL